MSSSLMCVSPHFGHRRFILNTHFAKLERLFSPLPTALACTTHVVQSEFAFMSAMFFSVGSPLPRQIMLNGLAHAVLQQVVGIRCLGFFTRVFFMDSSANYLRIEWRRRSISVLSPSSVHSTSHSSHHAAVGTAIVLATSSEPHSGQNIVQGTSNDSSYWVRSSVGSSGPTPISMSQSSQRWNTKPPGTVPANSSIGSSQSGQFIISLRTRPSVVARTDSLSSPRSRCPIQEGRACTTSPSASAEIES